MSELHAPSPHADADADPRTDADAQALIAALDARTVHETATVDGCPVVFRRIGQGPALVLLHGGHGNWLHWVRNIDALSRHHTLWVADMPGYGDSGVPAGEQTLDLIVRTLAAALDQLLGTSQPVDIAGFSFGGLCAATLAARRPAVGRVALLGPGGHGQARRVRLGMLNWRDLPPGPERDIRLRHNLAALMLHDEAHIDALALALHRQACADTRYRSKNLSMRPMLPEALAVLAERQVPVLLAWGEHDVTAVPGEAGPAMLAGAPRSELAIVPNAGHWVQYEAPEATQRLLLDWLGGGKTGINLLRVPISHLRSSTYRSTSPVLDATSGLLDNGFFPSSLDRSVPLGEGAGTDAEMDVGCGMWDKAEGACKNPRSA